MEGDEEEQGEEEEWLEVNTVRDLLSTHSVWLRL